MPFSGSQTTALQPSGTPGRTRSFSAKTAAVVISTAQLYPFTNIHSARFGASRFGFARFGFVPHDTRMSGSDVFYEWCLDDKTNEAAWKRDDIANGWVLVRSVDGE